MRPFAVLISHKHFNPRSREGSDKTGTCTSCDQYKFQSTLPRRERLWHSSYICMYPIISIHAPAKGATILTGLFSISSFISIHAPAKGATPPGPCLSMRGYKFQSTLPRRERLITFIVFSSFFTISIHAPAKGATRKEAQ